MKQTLFEQCVGLPAPETPLLIAVSGGCDSMVLLNILRESQQWPLHVYHLDHQLRDDSQLDARLVADYCDRHALNRSINTADIATLAKQHKQGIEEYAREHRYRQLQDIAAEHSILFIATAHHRDDQIESILMNLMRGAETHGLAGMRHQRALGDCILIRPFLELTRAAIRATAEKNQIVWREDSSNQDTRYQRNHLRQVIIPALEKVRPGFAEALLQQASAKRQQTDIWDACIDSEWSYCLQHSAITLDILQHWSPETCSAFWRRLLMHFSLPLSKVNIQRCQELLNGETSKQLPLGDMTLYRNQLQITWSKAEDDLIDPVLFAEKTELAGITFSQQTVTAGNIRTNNPDQAHIKPEAIQGDLYLRNISDGEEWQPLGAPGHKNVFQYLSDKKYPIQKRRTYIVVADEQGIIWIPGFTIAERVKVEVGDECWLMKRDG